MTMEDIDGGLHPVVDGQSLEEDENEESCESHTVLFAVLCDSLRNMKRFDQEWVHGKTILATVRLIDMVRDSNPQISLSDKKGFPHCYSSASICLAGISADGFNCSVLWLICVTETEFVYGSACTVLHATHAETRFACQTFCLSRSRWLRLKLVG